MGVRPTPSEPSVLALIGVHSRPLLCATIHNYIIGRIVGHGKLSVMRIRALRDPGRYGDGGGLWLQVRGPERKSWLFRYQKAGKARTMGLGAWPAVSLAEARQKAADARRLLAAGIDPLGQKGRPALPPMFREVALAYIEGHRAGWRSAKYGREWTSTLERFVFPVLGDMAVSDVDVGAVMRVLDPIWRKVPETASRVRGRIEAVLDYASARGWRTGENPARWRGHLANLLPRKTKVRPVRHYTAMPWQEVPAFVRVLRTQEGIAARALEFCILTAARTREVLGAKWSEIDVGAGLWTVPTDRIKAGRQHRVPVSAPALRILEQSTGYLPSPLYVFPGRAGQLHHMALLRVLRRMERADVTVHGFRSAFRDWAAEATNAPREVCEMALGHAIGDRTEAAYRRGDLFEKRRALMAEWARFCA